MPLVILQKQFVPMVLSGEKQMTIRAIRKRRFRLGDKLCFYANGQGNSRKKVGEAKVVNVELVRVVGLDDWSVELESYVALSKKMGFTDIKVFLQYFADTYGLPFIGQIVEWGDTFKGVKQL